MKGDKKGQKKTQLVQRNLVRHDVKVSSQDVNINRMKCQRNEEESTLKLKHQREPASEEHSAFRNTAEISHISAVFIIGNWDEANSGQGFKRKNSDVKRKQDFS